MLDQVFNIKDDRNAQLRHGTLDPVRVAVAAFRRWVIDGVPTDPDVVRFATKISIWGRWAMCCVVVFQLSYRPETWYPDDTE